MGFTLIIVGITFFLNPIISLIDIFPDFIGCALILLGLGKLSSISPELDSARPYFKYMLYISVARTVIFFASNGFDDVMRITLTMLFACIEAGIAIMAFPALYDGFAYLNIRYSGKVKEMPEFKSIGIIFFIARGIFSLLPHFSQLAYILSENYDSSLGSVEETVSTLNEYTGILTLTNVILTLIFAAFWMVAVASYIGKLSRDKDFISAVKGAYLLKLENEPGYFTRRTLVLGTFLMTTGGVFLLDIIGNGINLIPDFVFPILAVCALAVMMKYITSHKKALISGGIYAVLSIANYIYFTLFMQRRFHASFDFMITHFPHEYIIALVFALAEGVSLIYFAYRLYISLTPIIEREITQDTPEIFVRSAKLNDKFIKETIILLKVYCIWLGVTAVSSLLFSAFLHPIPIYWMIHLLINVVFVCISIALFSRVKAGVCRRYERAEEF